MNTSIIRKAGATGDPINEILEIDGNPVDLTGATVVFVHKLRPAGVKAEAAVTIVDELAGSVTVPNAFAIGVYDYHWKITYPDLTVDIIPAEGFYTLTVGPTLS